MNGVAAGLFVTYLVHALGQYLLDANIPERFLHLFGRAELYRSLGRKICRKLVKRHSASQFLVFDFVQLGTWRKLDRRTTVSAIFMTASITRTPGNLQR